jgi:hypothetical protein
VLLPVLLNQAPTPAPPAQNGAKRGAKNDKQKDEKQKDEKQKDEKQKDEKQKDNASRKLDWRATDWAATGWAGFDWAHFDWNKVDWADLNWAALGWGDNAHADTIRDFVRDVQTCKDDGWQSAGFHSAGDCVAYYIKAHAPADFDWHTFGWGRVWMEYGGKDKHGLRNRYGWRGDDN